MLEIIVSRLAILFQSFSTSSSKLGRHQPERFALMSAFLLFTSLIVSTRAHADTPNPSPTNAVDRAPQIGGSPSAESSTDSIEGLVNRDSTNKLWLVSDDQSSILISGATASVDEDLSKLQDGDWLIARGSIETSKRTATVSSINGVGLRQVIGLWKSSKFQLFEFRDFSRVNLYAMSSHDDSSAEPSRLGAIGQATQMKYTLAPEAGNRWSIFLADKKTVHIGTLEIEERRMRLILLDGDTGRETDNLTLVPFSSQAR